MFVNLLALISSLKLGGSEQGNVIRNNVIIGVSGAEGLSSPEVLTPAGVYVCKPSHVVEVRSSPGRSELRGRTGHSRSYLEWQHQWCGAKCYLLRTGVEKL